MNIVTVSLVPDDLRIPAAWLEAALAEGEVSASSLARRLGVEVNTVSRWRRGAVPLSRLHWIAICAVLGLPLGWQPPSGFKPAAPKTGRPRTKPARRR